MISAEEYLNKLTDKSVWVFTKQDTDFDTSVFATKLLSEIVNIESVNVEDYFRKYHEKYGIETYRHRELVIPQFYGLLTKTPFYQRGSQYNKERPTQVFDELNKILYKNSDKYEFTDIKRYNIIKTEQLLKFKIHAIIDTVNNNQDYAILPIVFIYKVLNELKTKYNINEISINHLYTYVMTCKRYNEWENAVRFISDNAPISNYVNQYKSNSRVLTCIKANVNLFDITRDSIRINEKFDQYFYNNFMLKYDLDELSEVLVREVDYSYFLYNLQDFNIDLINEPSKEEIQKPTSIIGTGREIIESEFDKDEIDDNYETRIDELKDENINTDVAKGAHKVQPQDFNKSKISKKYKRNPLLGKIAIKNAYYCCESDADHKTFKSKKSKQNFMEAHHLVPVKYQNEIWDKYNINVDCVENIISLCPTCHRAFHNGTDEVKSDIIDDLFEKLKARYKSIGFDITVNEIKKMYGIKGLNT